MSTTSASALGRLGALKTTAPKKKGGKEKPGITVAELEAAVEAYIEQRSAMETAETLMNQAKDQISTKAEEERLRISTAGGVNVSSITVNGRLTYTRQNRYSIVPEDAADLVRDAMGDDFERYFETCIGLKLTDEAAADESVVGALLEALGEDFIARHFVISQDLKVRKGFHDAFATNEELRERAQPLVDSHVIRCAAGSLKVK